MPRAHRRLHAAPRDTRVRQRGSVRSDDGPPDSAIR